ncbi:methyltransferase domain-containing protein [Shewanella profunda]|uniref:class I SAM-dependent DNA methyltransferase n=1 Tax=Shewanella profunda TaxID=254793 RepID=UPI00200F423E|nr:class I SAM-dependent methyltransferase [Shewanella profunda]MCL1089717.1 methyltransferase domain-containing protein [Shewanella profunda]
MKLKPQTQDNYQLTVATFDKFAQQYQDKYMEFASYTQTYDALINNITHHNHLLDIGCGPGNISRYLAAKIPQMKVFGIDLSPNMIELAKQNVPTGQFEIMDNRQLGRLNTLSAGSFDIIACGFCLPYLSKVDLVDFFKQLSMLICPDGLVYLSTMEDVDSRSGLQTGSSGDSVYVHYHQYDFIEQQLITNGFQILEISRQTFPVPCDAVPTTDLFIIAKAIR